MRKKETIFVVPMEHLLEFEASDEDAIRDAISNIPDPVILKGTRGTVQMKLSFTAPKAPVLRKKRVSKATTDDDVTTPRVPTPRRGRSLRAANEPRAAVPPLPEEE